LISGLCGFYESNVVLGANILSLEYFKIFILSIMSKITKKKEKYFFQA
jgi:hypothetical protein